jgi:hypothetical protein
MAGNEATITGHLSADRLATENTADRPAGKMVHWSITGGEQTRCRIFSLLKSKRKNLGADFSLETA